MKTKWAKRFVCALALLTVGWWSSDIGADPPDKAKKVTVCHKGQTLEVPESALQAHLGHGDTLGPCSITPSQNR
jgi:hypothetical protein